VKLSLRLGELKEGCVLSSPKIAMTICVCCTKYSQAMAHGIILGAKFRL